MYTLQVTADKLNIRSSPEADMTYANLVGMLILNDEFIAVDKVKGEMVNGSDEWYVDNLHRYVAAGWLKVVASAPLVIPVAGDVAAPAAPQDPAVTGITDFWFRELKIAEIQAIENGEFCNVLILDTGINDDLPAFKDVIIKPVVNVSGNGSSTCNDADSHGNHCAGLIAGRPGKYIIGASLKSELYVGKISENGQLDDAGPIKKALTAFLTKTDIDIISISQATKPDPELFNLIEKYKNKNTIVIAAIGNDEDNENTNRKRYPAFYDNCIAVGSCENDKSPAKYTYSLSRVDMFCYGTDIKSVKKQSTPEPLTGTSQSTAIVAGICAVVISFLKRNKVVYNFETLKLFLKKYSSDLKGHTEYRLIDPQLLFAKLLKLKQNENKSLQDFMDTDHNNGN